MRGERSKFWEPVRSWVYINLGLSVFWKARRALVVKLRSKFCRSLMMNISSVSLSPWAPLGVLIILFVCFELMQTIYLICAQLVLLPLDCFSSAVRVRGCCLFHFLSTAKDAVLALLQEVTHLLDYITIYVV